MRMLSLAEENRIISEVQARRNFKSTAIESSLTHVTPGTPTMQFSTPRPSHHSELVKTVNDIETTYTSMNQILESFKAIVQSTQHAIMSADNLLHQKIAQISRDLSRADIQIQQLKVSAARIKDIKKSMTVAALNGNTKSSKFEDPEFQRNVFDTNDTAIIEIFFDCVSRFSSRDSAPSIDRSQVNFFDSPVY